MLCKNKITMIKPKSGINHAINRTKISNSNQITTNFGTRKISNQNFSKMITIPKTALENLGKKITNLKVELVYNNKERFLKLSPVKGEKN